MIKYRPSYKIREILIKNQKEKPREIFRGVQWIDQYTNKQLVRTKHKAVVNFKRCLQLTLAAKKQANTYKSWVFQRSEQREENDKLRAQRVKIEEPIMCQFCSRFFLKAFFLIGF